MSTLGTVYQHSLALLTDLYQLTMAQAYWRSGLAARRSVFHLFFRDNPFGGGFSIACGLAQAVEYLDSLAFNDDDCAYLATLRGADGEPLFAHDFLVYLNELRLACDIDAVAEGPMSRSCGLPDRSSKRSCWKRRCST